MNVAHVFSIFMNSNFDNLKHLTSKVLLFGKKGLILLKDNQSNLPLKVKNAVFLLLIFSEPWIGNYLSVIFLKIILCLEYKNSYENKFLEPPSK